MITKMIYDSENPEDRDEMKFAMHGKNMALLIWSLLHEDLRAKIKYGNDFKDADEALEWINDKIHERLDDDCINIDAIVN